MDQTPLDLYNHYQTIENKYPYVQESIIFIDNVMKLYNFQNGTLYLSFNGGKDATVVLYLTLFSLMNTGNMNPQINCIYFEELDAFEEVDEFIQQQRKYLNLENINLPNNIRKGLQIMKETKNLQAVIMGTRSTDPYASSLEKITVTDKGYPPFLRINPILYWSHQQVWDFLLNFKIPYCKLYAQGYTYLGNKKNTQVNQQLKTETGVKPAWEATDDTELLSRKTITESKEQKKISLYLILAHLQEQQFQQTTKADIYFIANEADLIQKFKVNWKDYSDIIIKKNLTELQLREFLNELKSENKVDL